MEKDFRLIIRMEKTSQWALVSNPTWKPPHAEFLACAILRNEFNDYVQWKNGGMVFRVIRARDVARYELDS